jgi:hypothetical protein
VPAPVAEEISMNEQRADVLSRSILAVHRLAGPLTVATWLAVCGGFALDVVPRHDAAERLYQMDAARDELVRSAAAAAAAQQE